jgi:hypothetical protein
MSFGDDTEPFADESDELGPYPEPPTPEAVRVYATRRADLASAKALRTGDPLDIEIATLWIKRIEPAVEDATNRQRAEARLRAHGIEVPNV